MKKCFFLAAFLFCVTAAFAQPNRDFLGKWRVQEYTETVYDQYSGRTISGPNTTRPNDFRIEIQNSRYVSFWEGRRSDDNLARFYDQAIISRADNLSMVFLLRRYARNAADLHSPQR